MRINKIFSFLIVLSFVANFAFLAHLNSQETQQNQQLNELQQQIDSLKNNFAPALDYNQDAFNYLAIGNSITIHEKCDYWWNEIGMAASVAQKDYFHLVTDFLNASNKEVVSYAYNFSIWETHSNDRTQTISSLKKYLSADLDLITVQLSENVENLDTFEADLKELIAFLQKSCPAANIILVDDFWSDEKSILKEQIAQDMGIHFAALSNIRNSPEYICGLNTIVYGDDGKPHSVDHSGVAAHPGDKGMQAIASAIINTLQN